MAEDDRAFATFLGTALSGSREAADVRTAFDLAGAREALTAGLVDAVLLDLNLPDSRGLATHVGILEASPDVAIVVLTSVDDADVARSAPRLRKLPVKRTVPTDTDRSLWASVET